MIFTPRFQSFLKGKTHSNIFLYRLNQSATPNGRELDGQYAIEGTLTDESIQYYKNLKRGILYLTSDAGQDLGAPDGFRSISKHFSNEESKHVPLISSNPTFQKEELKSLSSYHAIKAYKSFEEALDILPTPTIISCRTGTRASAVYSVYKAFKDGLSPEEMMKAAKEKDLPFLKSEGLLAWVTCVIQTLRGTKKPIVFRQLFEKTSSTYTYLLADSVTKTAVLVDPVLETVERDLALVKALKLNLKYCINTHIHADHITGSGLIKSKLPEVQSVLSIRSNGKADVKVNDYEAIVFGERKLYLLPTPGHTEGCSSLVLDNLSMVFTGDALLIRGCGRTDFQGGSASILYKSVHREILQSLPKSCLVYPAHDYNGMTCSTVGEELEWNPRLTKTEEEFIHIMDHLNLPKPAKIDAAVPANMNCGGV